MSKPTEVLIAITCIAVLFIGGLYLSQRVHIGCLFGNCALIVTK